MDKIAWNKFKNYKYCTIRYYGSVYGDIHIKKIKSKFRLFKTRNFEFNFEISRI